MKDSNNYLLRLPFLSSEPCPSQAEFNIYANDCIGSKKNDLGPKKGGTEILIFIYTSNNIRTNFMLNRRALESIVCLFGRRKNNNRRLLAGWLAGVTICITHLPVIGGPRNEIYLLYADFFYSAEEGGSSVERSPSSVINDIGTTRSVP